METCVQFIENTRRIINQRGYKDKAIAEKIGVSANQFSSMMNNRKIITAVDVMAIANALEVTPNELFGIGDK